MPKGNTAASSTPSPLSLGLQNNSLPRPRTGSVSSNGSKNRSPYVSPSLTLDKKGKSSSRSKSDVEIEVENLDSPLCRSLWNVQKCPCNRSNNSWLIDCSKCKQYWHTECVTLDGLNEKDINKLVKWLCPLCYVCPISTTDHMIIDSASSCMSCRNTRSLRDANQQFEVSAAAENLRSLQSLGKSLATIDIDKLNK